MVRLSAETRDEAVPSGPVEPTELSDDLLVARMREGDQAAFDLLYRRHAGDVQRYVRRLCSRRDLVEDIVAEAFFKTLRAVANGRGPVDGFRAYVFTAARTTAIRMQGLVSNEVPSPSGDLLVDTDAQLAAEQEADGVGPALRALQQLPERARRVLWLVEVEGWSNTEVARDLGISANAAGALVYRSRRRLRACFEAISEP